MARVEITLATNYETVDGDVKDIPGYAFSENFYF